MNTTPTDLAGPLSRDIIAERPARKPADRGRLAATRTALEDATTYAEWKAAAIERDERTGKNKWKRTDYSSQYDYRVIRLRRDELRAVRESGDPQALMYVINEGIHGNMGGMGNASLYSQATFGTKDLITDYIREQCAALIDLERVPDNVIAFDDRLALFRRASHCFGRSALMLSGGGALGPFHLGVCKTLLEENMLPTVISGASAGSFVAAVLGTHSRADVMARLQPNSMADVMSEFEESERDVIQGRRQIGLDALRHSVEQLIPDVTFEEAYEISGLKINVSISPAEQHQRSRLMNAVTSPNVFVREAVLASCAIPGIFPAVQLAAKDVNGQRRPYVASRRWVDGSVTDDLPAKRLARLYGVNHFITSQTNPIVLWMVRDRGFDNGLPGRVWDLWESVTKEWMKFTYPVVNRLTRDLYPLNLSTRLLYSVAMQDYTADINIIPQQRFWDPRKLLSVLTEDETAYLIRQGEKATWPKVEMIRNCTMISRTLDEILGRMEQRTLAGAHALGLPAQI